MSRVSTARGSASAASRVARAFRDNARNRFKTFTISPGAVKNAHSRQGTRKVGSLQQPQFDLYAVFNEFVAVLLRAVNDPVFLLLTIVAAVTVYFHYTSFATGPVGLWVKENPSNKLAVWVAANEKRFLGAVVFLPTVYKAPAVHRSLIGVLVVLWVALIPESGVYQYIVQSAALFMYVNVKRSTSRLMLIAAVSAVYWSGWFVTPTTKSEAPRSVKTPYQG